MIYELNHTNYSSIGVKKQPKQVEANLHYQALMLRVLRKRKMRKVKKKHPKILKWL